LAGLAGGEQVRMLRNAMHASEQTGRMQVQTGMKMVFWAYVFLHGCVYGVCTAKLIPRAGPCAPFHFQQECAATGGAAGPREGKAWVCNLLLWGWPWWGRLGGQLAAPLTEGV